jgi:hypothetical protein
MDLSDAPNSPAYPSRESGWNRTSTAWGLPCCVCSPCADMPSPLPRRDRWWDQVAPLKPTTAAFPFCRQGRLPHLLVSGPARRSLALRPVCSRNRSTVLSTEGFGDFVTSTAAPIATGWSNSCQVGIAPTEEQRLCTAHRQQQLPQLGNDIKRSKGEFKRIPVFRPRRPSR